MELASICRRAHTELDGTAILSRSRGRDRWFESTFLQRRVACEPEDDMAPLFSKTAILTIRSGV